MCDFSHGRISLCKLFAAGRISLRKQSTASQVLAVKGSAGQTIRVPATRSGLEPDLKYIAQSWTRYLDCYKKLKTLLTKC